MTEYQIGVVCSDDMDQDLEEIRDGIVSGFERAIEAHERTVRATEAAEDAIDELAAATKELDDAVRRAAESKAKLDKATADLFRALGYAA